METNEKQAPQIILKLPNKSKYVAKLKKMVKERKGKLDGYVLGQIERTASLWRQVDKMEIEMANTPTLIQGSGSTGQDKCTINPIISEWNKLNRTLDNQFKALGLNYDIAPEKVNDADANNENDPLAKMLESNERTAEYIWAKGFQF